MFTTVSRVYICLLLRLWVVKCVVCITKDLITNLYIYIIIIKRKLVQFD